MQVGVNSSQEMANRRNSPNGSVYIPAALMRNAVRARAKQMLAEHVFVNFLQWGVETGGTRLPHWGDVPGRSALHRTRECIGEWTFYATVPLIIIALLKRFPYRYFFKTRRLLAVAYIALAFHSVILMKPAYWYARKIQQGKRHNQALIALARRRCDVLFAMLRTGPFTNPSQPLTLDERHRAPPESLRAPTKKT
jgi:hypothetical protein